MRWMRKKNMGTVMLTGDNERTAEKVAAELKIDSVYAELMPEDKVQLLEEFCNDRMENEKLAFVGDGMNDAPVLALADIGIAMGGLGADAALEAADIILMEDEPSKIINAVRIAKGTIRSVRGNVLFAIGMKVFLVILAFFGLVTMQSAIIADMVVMVINILNSFWMMKYPDNLLKEAIRIADENEDVEWATELRLDLIYELNLLSADAEEITVFSKILDDYENHKDVIKEDDLLWKYKWIWACTFDLPEIPMEQVQAIGEDYKTRILRNGYSLRSYYHRWSVECVWMRQYDKAKEYTFPHKHQIGRGTAFSKMKKRPRFRALCMRKCTEKGGQPP